jgi:zinc protease
MCFGALGLAVLAACGGVNVVKPEGVKLPPLEFPLRTLAYPSGLTVLVEKDERTQLAGVFVVVGSGSTNDPIGKEGLAHYIEHLTFRSRPTGRATVWNLLEQAGVATFNAFTSFDDTVYYEVGLASHLTDMLQLEGRRMANPVLLVTDAERATELDVVRNELRLKNETGYLGEALGDLDAAVYPPGHPYARPVGGTHESMASIKRADVDAYLRDNYKPENMTLLILGNIDLATADKLIAESIPRKLLEAPQKVAIGKRIPDIAPAVPDAPPQTRGLPMHDAAVASPEVWVAWTMPRAFDSNAYLAEFVANVAQRRLAGVIQDDKDIAAVGVTVIPGKEASMLLAIIQLNDGAHPQDSLDKVLNEVPKIWNDFSSTNSVGEVAFGRERRAATIGEVSAAQDLGTRGLARVTAMHFAGDPTLYSRTVRSLTEMRQQQVSDYAAPYITKERARAIYLVPETGSASALARGGAASAPGAGAGSLGPSSNEARAALQEADEKERLKDLLALPKDRQTYQLENGMTVILERRTGLPLLSAAISFPGVASTLDEAVSARLARSTGGIQFRYEALASGHGDSEALLNGSPEAIGAEIRSSHGEDRVTYSIEGASGNADLLLALLGEYPRTLSIGRGSVLGFQEYEIPYLKRQEKEPRVLADRQFLATLLAGSPYGIAIDSHALEGATQGGAESWLKRSLVPNDATLVVVGDYDPKEIRKLIADSFGQWKKDPAVTPSLTPAALVAEGSATEAKILVTPRQGATQSELLFGCLLPEAKTASIGARHLVAAEVLSDRLWTAVRIKLGATYGIGARAVYFRGGTSYLQVNGAVETGKLGPVLAAIQGALTTVRTEAPAPANLSWAKIKAADGSAVANMLNEGVISGEVKRATMGFAFENPADESLESVTGEEVRADLEQCLRSRPTLSIVGDEPTVRAALKEGWK